jgi:hypothetical protein
LFYDLRADGPERWIPGPTIARLYVGRRAELQMRPLSDARVRDLSPVIWRRSSVPGVGIAGG